MKATFGFDTLAYANKLKTAGIPSEIAEAHAIANAELMENLVEGTLATKQDIIILEAKLENKITEVKSDLRQEIKDLENRLTIRVGALIIGSLGAFATILSLLHMFH